MARGQDGQVLPLVALIVVLVGAACLGLGRLGGAAVARAQAQTAADAAALAGVAEGRQAAAAAAGWNGARLVSYEETGLEARVGVELGRARASARAGWVPLLEEAPGEPLRLAIGPRPGRHAPGRRPSTWGGRGEAGGLVPAMRAALARAGELLGAPVPITSGYRSRAQQAALYARRAQNPYPVAPPGRSRHERGTAVDVPASFVPRLLRVAHQVGLCHPYPVSDPVHFELCTTGLP